MANLYGDVELTPRGMRALAHPVRLALLSQLHKGGPSTATALAPLVGASPSVTSWHLRHLAEHGLVKDAEVGGDGRQRWWEAVGTGFRFAADDESTMEAATALSHLLMDEAADLPAQWVREVEPHLEVEWRQFAGLSNTTIEATVEELAEIEAAIERALAPFVLRRSQQPGSVPGARRVRVLRYVLPDGGPVE